MGIASVGHVHEGLLMIFEKFGKAWVGVVKDSGWNGLLRAMGIIRMLKEFYISHQHIVNMLTTFPTKEWIAMSHGGSWCWRK